MRGASSAAPSPRIQFPGFLLDRGRYTAFEVAGAVTQTFPIGINDRGQIVGYYDELPERSFTASCGRRTAGSPRIDFPGAPRNARSASTTAARSWASTRIPMPRRMASRAPCRCR